MLKIDPTALDDLEASHPGIRSQVMDIENATLPPCPQCGSTDTAVTRCGVVGRSIAIAAATSKIKLLANRPPPGRCCCNICGGFFDDAHGAMTRY